MEKARGDPERLVQRGPARARPLVEVGPAADQRRHQRLVTVGGGHVQRTDLAFVSGVDTDLASGQRGASTQQAARDSKDRSGSPSEKRRRISSSDS